jgi:hypothetical protein
MKQKCACVLGQTAQLYCCTFVLNAWRLLTIELITFRILFFSLFVLMFHCYAVLLFVIKARQAAVDVKRFVPGKVHFISLQILDPQTSVLQNRTSWLKLRGCCFYPGRASFRYGGHTDV